MDQPGDKKEKAVLRETADNSMSRMNDDFARLQMNGLIPDQKQEDLETSSVALDREAERLQDEISSNLKKIKEISLTLKRLMSDSGTQKEVIKKAYQGLRDLMDHQNQLEECLRVINNRREQKKASRRGPPPSIISRDQASSIMDEMLEDEVNEMLRQAKKKTQTVTFQPLKKSGPSLE